MLKGQKRIVIEVLKILLLFLGDFVFITDVNQVFLGNKNWYSLRNQLDYNIRFFKCKICFPSLYGLYNPCFDRKLLFRQEQGGQGGGEPEVKKRREDMGQTERLEFDVWIQDIQTKLQVFLSFVRTS